MKEEELRKIIGERLTGNQRELFVKFFQKRFPNESARIESYTNEWIDRFMSSNPMGYMDKLSKEIYLDLKEKCEHKDGWYTDETLVINPEMTNDNNVMEFKCNTLGCEERRKFKFDICNVEGVS